jgi:hypothetical protein
MFWALCKQGKYSIVFSHAGGGGASKREREVLAVEGLNPRKTTDGAGNYPHLCGGSSRRPPAV